MIVLGLTDPICRDNAAAILVDGELIAMVEEERLNRIKHAPHMVPEKAVQWCLDTAGVSMDDVDVIAVGFSHPNAVFSDAMRMQAGRLLRGQPRRPSPRREYRRWRTHRMYLAQLEQYLKGRDNVMFVRHHVAHAASTFFLSPFEEAGIVSLDGSGGQDSGLLAFGRGTEISALDHVDRESSWGVFYETYTGHLGFKRHSDEGKVMGLAAYGDPREGLLPFIHMPDGAVPYYREEDLVTAARGIKRRPKGAPPIDGYYEHVAARLQYSLEQVVARMTEILYKRTGLTDLCMAGGTALNCSCNGKLLGLPHVERIFVQPAASDCGTALGAAVYAHVQITGKRPTTVFDHAYWGPDFSNEEIEALLREAKVPYRRSDDIEAETARLISENRIVGWFQGRMEVGPRALGGRSILADPTDPDMKDKVNREVKHREPWRPFAPSILVEHMEEYFGTDHPSPFMILAFQAREEVKSKIPAALHVDGTGRPQTVDRRTNPRYWRLIDEFRKLTGVPVVLNTSFNVAGQPIVCSPRDALSTFYMCGLDVLAIGDFLVTKDGAGGRASRSTSAGT